MDIQLDKISESPYQGRLIMGGAETEQEGGDLKALAASISENGLLNPVVVRPAESGFEMVDGHRRLGAHRILGRDTIQAIVKEMNEKETQVFSLVANLQRQGLHNIEKAFAFRKILDAGIFRDKRELSKAIGKDETYVGDLLSTLKMDSRIIEDLLKNKPTNDVRVLRAIRKVEDSGDGEQSERQWELYRRFISEGLSRNEVFAIAREARSGPGKGIRIKVRPRRIEIDLPTLYPKQQRAKLEKMIYERLNDLFSDVSESADDNE